MKIAFIVNVFPKVSETFILNQITGLLDMGHEVMIFAEYNPNENKVHLDVEIYQLMDRVLYFDIPKNKIKRVMKASYLIITNFYKHPIKIFKSLTLFRYGKSALSLQGLYFLIPFLDTNFDIIHCHFGPNGIIGASLKEIGVEAKIITTFHGYDMSTFILNNGTGVYNDLFIRGDLFLAISEHWKKKLVGLGGDAKKIKVHRMGIDLEKFKYSERKILPGESVKILTVGRLVEKKGHKYAIKAIAKLINKHKNVIYTIVGDGYLRGELESLATELGIENHVKFLGDVEDEELFRLYHDSHIFVLPSVTARNGGQEGIPVVLMETQAAGLPVISTFHSGIPEVVLDGESGFLVPERDVNTLTKKLEYLVLHPEIWPEMGRAGRKVIEARYDVRKLNQQLVKRYKALLTADTDIIELKESKRSN